MKQIHEKAVLDFVDGKCLPYFAKQSPPLVLYKMFAIFYENKRGGYITFKI